jgi:mono/diheme cytochrome c family protein
MFKKVVNAVEVVALVAMAAFAILLVAYRPAAPTASSRSLPSAADVAGDPLAAGAAIFKTNCSGCHGPSGEGVIGPKLANGAVVAKYPNAANEVAVVSNGRGTMPAWSGKLTAAQIEAVVRYTREGL